MAAISGRDIGKALCDVLGLSDKRVTNLRLEIPCDGIVTVEATMLVEEAEGTELVEVLKRYELRERGTEETVSDLGQGIVDVTSMADDYRRAVVVNNLDRDDIRRMEQMRAMPSTVEPEPKGIKFREFL